MKIKPGYKTSEFWFTLVSFVFSGLYLFGIIDDNSQKEDLIQETSKGVEATILIIGQLMVLFRYVKGRNELKKIWWSTNPNETQETPKPTPKKPRKNNTTPSIKKKPSKKTN